MSPTSRTRTTTLATLFTLSLALTACGTEDPPTDDSAPPPSEDSAEYDGEFREGDIPTADPDESWEDEVDLPAEPASDAPLADQIEHELLTATFEFTREPDPEAVAECPEIDSGESSEATCTTTILGETLDWKVTISGGSVVASYEYESDQRVLSRSHAEAALRFEADTTAVACELDEQLLVDPENVEAATCYSEKDGTTTVWDLSVSAYGDIAFLAQ